MRKIKTYAAQFKIKSPKQPEPQPNQNATKNYQKIDQLKKIIEAFTQ